MCWMDSRMHYSMSQRVHDRGGHVVSHCNIHAYWAFKVQVEVRRCFVGMPITCALHDVRMHLVG